MAYWQNGKVYVHTGTQSTAQTVPAIARWLGVEPDKVVLISEYTGGGFREQSYSGHYADHPRAALEEGECAGDDAHQPRRRAIHWTRSSKPAWPHEGGLFLPRKAGSQPSICSWICDNGPYDQVGDAASSGRIVSLLLSQPLAACAGGPFRVLTNTPPRAAQSSPGGMQGITLMEPVLAKAARKLGVDQVATSGVSTRQKARRSSDPWWERKQLYATSAFIKEALERGAEMFKWDERKALPKRSGSKARGVGVSSSCYVGGSIGLRRPLRYQAGWQGIHSVRYRESTGTESLTDVHRVVAEYVGVPWEKV